MFFDHLFGIMRDELSTKSFYLTTHPLTTNESRPTTWCRHLHTLLFAMWPLCNQFTCKLFFRTNHSLFRSNGFFCGTFLCWPVLCFWYGWLVHLCAQFSNSVASSTWSLSSLHPLLPAWTESIKCSLLCNTGNECLSKQHVSVFTLRDF